ncbi:MAG: hypothetical protein LBH58_08485 [Tannerellaceae bacterium]|jgi:hypothetical protein|nr:hypothetical protein [Tannerellaceae bacterium]
MNNNFSLQRIKYLLLADWIENRKFFLLGAGALFIGLIAIQLLLGIRSIETQLAYFYLGGFVVFVYYCQYISNKVHKSKGLFYTLPANNLEKYLSFLLEGLFFFVGFSCVFWIGLFMLKAFGGSFTIVKFSQLYMGVSDIGLLCLVPSILFLSHLVFRRYAMLISFAGISLFVLLVGWISLKVLLVSVDYWSDPYSISNSALEALDFLMQSFTPALLVCSFVVLYVGYLKFKKKELR